VPAFRARATIEAVVTKALRYVDRVIVVDDRCPQGTGAFVRARFEGDARVEVIEHERNRGVGGAMKTGFAAAIRDGSAVVIKLDADDQMDSSYIPYITELLEKQPQLMMVKGNRFGSSSVIEAMPLVRLIGNSGLSFLVKLSSGYWNVIDPTNGYIAIRSEALRELDFDRLAERYFFEIDLLCALGLRKAPIAELEMPAIYGSENSSLSVTRALMRFPFALLRRFIKRLFVQYVLTDINVGTLYGAIGIPLLLIGMIFGSEQWAQSATTGIPRTSGTVVLALLLFIIGFQLLLQAISFDVQFAPRTTKARVLEGDLASTAHHEAHAVVISRGSA
jgi:glycosyltransferase involved in cell wall biosynthesis